MVKIKRTASLILVLALVLSLMVGMNTVVLANNNEVYVDAANCPGPGSGTPSDPFCSIQAGIDAVAPGGTVYVAAGVYYEGDITIDKPLSLIGAGCGESYVDADGTSYVFHVTSDDVTISGFSIHGAFEEGIFLDEVQNCYILDNCIYENVVGIYSLLSSRNTIRHNEIYLNADAGIWLNVDSSNNLIEDNDIYQNDNLWSCPFFYSWDGSEYKLDSQPFAATKGLKTYYDELDYLTSVDGKYLTKITEEMYETAYIDEVKLITVDHPAGTQIVIDRSGNIYTMRAPYAPTTGIEEDGTSCLDAVRESDGIFWTSNMDNKDFSKDEDLRDGIILTFDKPASAHTAKIVLKFQNTPLFEEVNRILIGLPLDPSGTTDELRRFVIRPCLEVWSGGVMIFRERLSNPGSFVEKDDIRVIDISGVTGDEVTVKLESLTGLLMIDSVLMDFSADETVYTTELPVATAIDGNGLDTMPQLLSKDDNYFVLEEGDYANLSFNEPAALPGHERSCLVKAEGYYDSPFITDIASETRRDLLEQFLADPYYAMRYSLEKGLGRDSHCGILIGFDPGKGEMHCDDNEIRRNKIYENNGEGISLEQADYTLIILNEIYSNEHAGIYLYHSSDCEMYCNDIYENGPENLTGIYLGDNSWRNIINYNNIFGNVMGVYNENTAESIDATNNWWGCSAGPGNPGCDSVSDHVDYVPFSEEEYIDCPLTPSPIVGGTLSGESWLEIMAPWLAIGIAIIAGGAILLRRRSTHT